MHVTLILRLAKQQQQSLVLKQWLNVSTPTARNIARELLKECSPIDSHALFAKTQQAEIDPGALQKKEIIYKRLLSRQESRPPSNPLHPIRSLRYLKGVVLPDLVERGDAQKVFRMREATSEELELLSRTKPLTLSQRKRRGALGPGKRPPLFKNGRIHEWLWSITEQGQTAPLERERSDLEFGLIYDKDKKPGGSKDGDGFYEPAGTVSESELMTQKDILRKVKKWS